MTARPVVGIQSPGDMGHALGTVLASRGVRVMSCLEGRSDRTRTLAAVAGIVACPSFEALAAEADLILSVLVPGQALALAERLAEAIRTTGSSPLVADLNAIAPQTAQAVGELITAAGGHFADGGIIGPPPPAAGNRIFVSGPDSAGLAVLRQFGLDMRVLDGPVGRASGLKMCYAAMTKGIQALSTELLVAARLMGVDEVLREEQAESLAPILSHLAQTLPGMPPKAHRWVSEMEEIARTFEHLGLTPLIFEGAAQMYRFVASTAIGRESPEDRDQSRDMDGVIQALARSPVRAAE